MNWIRIENPDNKTISFVDLSEVDGAWRTVDGAITFWMKSGRMVTFSGSGGWLDKVWELFTQHTGLIKPAVPMPSSGVPALQP